LLNGNRALIKNAANAFYCNNKPDNNQNNEIVTKPDNNQNNEIANLHSKIGELLMEKDFLKKILKMF
jgi:hypothetical protein